jgi:hypothetical protein
LDGQAGLQLELLHVLLDLIAAFPQASLGKFDVYCELSEIFLDMGYTSNALHALTVAKKERTQSNTRDAIQWHVRYANYLCAIDDFAQA